jgi:Trk K+ transport system NAD-binding subunit
MKFIPAQLAYLLQSRPTRRNLHSLGRFLAFLGVMMLVYSIAFHFLMAAEGQQHSWITGLYWTLTVMSTLGFGDITFQSDAGRAFSMLVLVSGVVFLLVVLPFTFIQFFYAPWLEAQSRMRAPRQVPAGTRGHVILTHFDPVALSLVQRLRYHGRRHFVLEPDLTRALEMHDEGVPVIVGDRDKIESYRDLHVEDAALVVLTGDDYLNTNIAFTVRELNARVPVVAIARAKDSVDVLELAGATQVLHLPEMLGRALARRTLGGDVRANVIGRFGDLVIAEAPATGTPLIGRTIAQSRLREVTGMTVVGVWERGAFEVPLPETPIRANTVLVLAGTEEQLGRFAELMVIYSVSDAPALVIGGGRVGRAAARGLAEREIPYRILEQKQELVRDPATYVHGSAADRECLERAGIGEAGTVIVTTNDDATNMYLTVYCRRLRPDIQIISRATLERNVSTLHLAGADFVLSYASMGANAIYNVLEKGDVVMLAEGLDIFRTPVPPDLVGRSLGGTSIRDETGCSVIAIEEDGRRVVNPPADTPLPGGPGAELILIGTTASERRFMERYAGGGGSTRRR